MKYIVLCIAIVCSISINFAQQDSISKSIVLKLPNPTFYNKSVLTNEIEIPIQSEQDTVIDIKAEYWNTTIYNPYRNATVKFPLQLKFTDSTYSSPVLHEKVVVKERSV